MNFAEWLDENWEDDNIFHPPIDAELALNFLCEYLLGEDWYSYSPMSHKQIRTEMVENILFKYSQRYKNELKEIRRKNRC